MARGQIAGPRLAETAPRFLSAQAIGRRIDGSDRGARDGLVLALTALIDAARYPEYDPQRPWEAEIPFPEGRGAALSGLGNDASERVLEALDDGGVLDVLSRNDVRRIQFHADVFDSTPLGEWAWEGVYRRLGNDASSLLTFWALGRLLPPPYTTPTALAAPEVAEESMYSVRRTRTVLGELVQRGVLRRKDVTAQAPRWSLPSWVVGRATEPPLGPVQLPSHVDEVAEGAPAPVEDEPPADAVPVQKGNIKLVVPSGVTVEMSREEGHWVYHLGPVTLIVKED